VVGPRLALKKLLDDVVSRYGDGSRQSFLRGQAAQFGGPDRGIPVFIEVNDYFQVFAAARLADRIQGEQRRHTLLVQRPLYSDSRRQIFEREQRP
jgi:hypothetical protein